MRTFAQKPKAIPVNAAKPLAGAQAGFQIRQHHEGSAANPLTQIAVDFSRIPTCNTIIQTKLHIGAPGDEHERQADQIAGTVLNMPEPGTEPRMRLPIGRAKPGQATGLSAPPIVHAVLGSPGQPLAGAERALMERRFGHDFSQVRLHTDDKAAQAASALQARAYTSGRDIVFGCGQYQPGQRDGRWLLAHELTHVLQQTAAGPGRAAQALIQREPVPQAGTAPQLTQAQYDQAMASIATRSSINPRLLTILNRGRVGQTVRGVHSATSTVQVTAPAAPGSASPTIPAVTVSFDLEISANASSLPTGAFALFVNDPATQTSFSGQVTTGQVITRLLKIVSKPATGSNAADLLGEALVHEGSHMLLAIDDLLSSAGIAGLSRGLTGAQASFARYLQAAAASRLRAGLDTALVAEVNRVFTPAGARAPTIGASAANQAVGNVITNLLEERFAVDQQIAAYPRSVSNATLASAYLWDLLAAETGRSPWPQGANAQRLLAAMAAFLDDVLAQINRPPTAPGGAPKTAPSGGNTKRP